MVIRVFFPHHFGLILLFAPLGFVSCQIRFVFLASLLQYFEFKQNIKQAYPRPSSFSCRGQSVRTARAGYFLSYLSVFPRSNLAVIASSFVRGFHLNCESGYNRDFLFPIPFQRPRSHSLNGDGGDAGGAHEDLPRRARRQPHRGECQNW